MGINYLLCFLVPKGAKDKSRRCLGFCRRVADLHGQFSLLFQVLSAWILPTENLFFSFPTSVGSKRLLRMASRRKKEPLHKIFYLCSTYTHDTSWADFLLECAYGKFPKGVRFEDNALKCSRKQQTFVQYIPKDVGKALEVILGVFRDRLGIKSHRERRKADAKFEKIQAASRITTWKDAKTAASKTSMLRNFVDRISAVYYLTADEKRDMIALLELCVLTKNLSPDRIKVESGIISEIQGLVFNPFTRKTCLAGALIQEEVEAASRPLDYVPVRQIPNTKNYLTVAEHHTKKLTMV